MRGCDGFQPLGRAINRREAVRVGALSLAGLSLPGLFAGRALAAKSRSPQGLARKAADGSFGQARSCILIFQWGGPSQLDTWDPKPDAPVGIRGQFASIQTATPGVRISEHFPLLAQQTNRLAIVRSMTHDDPAHLSTAHRLLTGHLAPTVNSDAIGPSPQDWPHLGSLLTKCRPTEGAMPTAVTMPWTVAHPAAPGGRAPGQHGGWLGKTFDPFAIEGDPNATDFRVPGLGLPDGVNHGRMAERRSLRSETATLELAGRAAGSWDQLHTRALDAISSAQARTAFSLDREDPRVRDRYGRHIHGQCLLLARRLVEAGVGLVTVNWHDDHSNFWDTHGDNFNQLKNRLMPPADRGFAALLEDLDARGLLDETLVVWVGEFGRTPKLTGGGTGREHWPRCYSAALAGAGVRGGQVYGASDKWAAYPSRDPVSPDDLGATILHALGVDPATEIRDPVGRPLRINNGNPVLPLFA
jgi:Protein of unknown function (DUF1501)